MTPGDLIGPAPTSVDALRLADICPRLAKARDDWYRHADYERRIERRRTTALLSAERVLAHRELQLVRAYGTDSARYIKERQRKLRAAQRKVDRLRGTT